MQRQNCLGNVSERQQLNLPELPPARFLVSDPTEGLLWMQSVASTVIFQVSEQVPGRALNKLKAAALSRAV